MKKHLLLLIFLSLISGLTSKTHAQNLIPEVQTAKYFDISKPLTEMSPLDNSLVKEWKKGIVKNGFRNKKSRIPDPDIILPLIQTNNGNVKAKAPTVNIEGCNNGDNASGVAPPDTQGDVGPNHYVQMVNNVTEIFDKNGTSIWGPQNSSTFWSGFNGSWTGTNDGDPIVLYDEQADRWLVSQFAVNCSDGTQWELIAVSTSGNPTGTYYRYAFQFTDMPDYPKLGIWNDGYYLSCNRFTVSGGNYNGVYACALDRTAMLAGNATAQMIKFDLASSADPYSMLPSDCDGSFPTAGTPNYFCYDTDDNNGWSSDRVKVWAFTANWVTPANSTFSEVASLTPTAFNSSFSDIAAIDQPNSTQYLHTLADRMMFRAQYRTFSDHQSIVLSRTVNLGSDRAAIRWYELRRTTESWSIYQQGTYAPDNDSRWMSSIAMNGSGGIALGYSVSSATTYPSIRYTGRRDGDALGTMTIAEESIFTGTASQSGVNRWGDYSMMSVDPADDLSFWYTQEYTTGGWNWHTRIAKFMFPDSNDPGNFIAGAVSTNQIDLSWNLNSNNDNVLLAWSSDGIFGTPADGTTYLTGNAIPGGGIVLYNGNLTAFNHSGLNSGTTYYYKLWSYTGTTEYSSGVAASAQTHMQSVFYDGFETNLGWTLTGEWQRTVPEGKGGEHGNPDPTTAYAGSNVLGYDLTGTGTYPGDYEANLTSKQYTAISPVIDCSNYTNVELQFQRWLGIESSSYDHVYIDISNNGGSTWTQLWTNDNTTFSETSWSEQTINLSSYADGQANVNIRFSIGATDGSWQYCGWNIDDLYIFGVLTSTTPTATVSSSPGCVTGLVTVISNLSGTQTFYLCDNSGSVLNQWTGSATSYQFTGLSDGIYRGQVEKDGNLSTLSSPVTLTNLANPTVPTNVNATYTDICSGQSTTLSYTGGSGTTFIWYSGSCGSTFVGSGNNLTVFPTGTTTYYGRWENTCGNSSCLSITINVTNLPVTPTTVGASNTQLCPGDNTTLSYTGGSGDTFNWYTGSCGGSSIGTGNNLTVYPTTTTTYYGRWSNGCGNSSCKSVSVNVGTTTVITDQPANVNANPGDNIAFTVVADGDALNYQWRFNGNNITGAESDNYSINDVQESDAGNYDVAVSGDCGDVLSDVAILSVAVSVEDLIQSGIQIFPNPSNGILHINFSKPEKSTLLKICDISGKNVYFEKLNKKENVLKLNKLTKGVYFVEIQLNNKLLLTKIVIE